MPRTPWTRSHARDELEKLPKAEKKLRVDLGLAILHVLRKPGAVFNTSEIALWCGCSEVAIQYIERCALHKLRHHTKVLKEL